MPHGGACAKPVPARLAGRRRCSAGFEKAVEMQKLASERPLAAAIIQDVQARQLSLSPVADFDSLVGKGAVVCKCHQPLAAPAPGDDCQLKSTPEKVCAFRLTRPCRRRAVCIFGICNENWHFAQYWPAYFAINLIVFRVLSWVSFSCGGWAKNFINPTSIWPRSLHPAMQDNSEQPASALLKSVSIPTSVCVFSDRRISSAM